jgi:hypothetical protein
MHKLASLTPDVSVICTHRVYFSSEFDVFFSMYSLGKSFQKNA